MSILFIDNSLIGSGGLTAGSDFTINGVLNLAADNPDETKGLLEMTIGYGDYSNILTPDNELTTRGTKAYDILSSYILTMGPTASFAGNGDVTGRVKRTSIAANTEYFMGSVFSSIIFSSAGTLPTAVMFVITKGSDRGIHANATAHDKSTVQRLYQIIQTGGSDPNTFILKLRYLDGELNSNDESKLVLWDHHIKYSSTNTPHEHGKTSQNLSENWVSLSGHAISYLATAEVIDGFTKYWMINSTGSSDENLNTWLGAGADLNGYKWDYESNWTKGTVPTSVSKVIITQTTKAPTLAETSAAATITIEAGAVLNGGTGTTLTVSGGSASNGGVGSWNNAGTFNAGTSTVVFDYTAGTFDGSTDFYNATINSGKELALQASSIMRISGIFTNNGVLNSYQFDNTVEYNGASQPVVAPGGSLSAYQNLILSGSGTKTMPATAMSILGDFTVGGTASATASNSLNIDGNVLIETNAIVGTGTFNHEIKGNINCNGTITPGAGSLITMNGSSAQNIQGEAESIALGGLSVSNTSGVKLYNHATTAALTIESGAFTVIAGKSLTAAGNTAITPAQGLVLKSDETGTASFIDNGTISGTARIERYLTPYVDVSDLKFHFISSPVSTTQAIAPVFIELSSEAITDFYKWDEPTNYWINFRGETYNSQNTSFGDGYNFVPGKGYMVAYPEAVVKDFSGTPNTSSAGISIPCTKTASTGYGWNLIGNPFPSAINWNTLTKSNVDATLYYYDNFVPGYKYYNTTSGGIGGATQYIAPMQGFMVHATSAGSVVISNTARTHLDQNVFYKNEPLTTNILDLKVEGNSKTDYTRVCFYDQATESFDSDFDAYKLFSYSEGNPELYTLASGDTPLAINTEPLSKLKGSVALGFKPGAAGSYTLTAKNIGSFSAEAVINLEDLATGTIQELTKNPVYTFAAGPGDNAGRFMLHFFAPVGIEEPESSALFIYSAGQEVRVMTADASTHTFTLVKLQGQVVFSKQLSGSGIYSFNLNLPAGIYIARVMNTQISKTQKLFIK